MASYGKRDDAVKQVLKAFGERKAGHDLLVEQWARMERAYLADVDPSDMASQWRSQLFPQYAMQIADTAAANLTDDHTRFKVTGRPRMDSPDEIQRHIQGARAHELLLGYQMERDRYDRKKAAYVLQNVKKGLTVMKVFWRTELGLRRSQEAEVVYDDLGQPVGVEMKDHEKLDIIRDDNSVDVVRVEDFLWDEAAVELQRSPWLIHRLAATLDELKQLQQLGVYRNVDDIEVDPEGRPIAMTDEFTWLDDELYQEDRYKGRVELLEYWCKHDGAIRCITIADRKHVLADRKELFNHGQYPFVACSTRPNEFRIPGHSLVESVRVLQEYQWTLDNQILDNIKLSNNMLFAYDETRIDPEKIELAPGALVGVDGGDVREVLQQFVPDSSVVDRALMVAARIKGDMQNISSAMPFMSGAQSDSIDQETATGVSIVTSLAQTMLGAQKKFITFSEEEIAYQMVCNNQQFIKTERLVPIVGRDGVAAFENIGPEILEGYYTVDAEPQNESLMRQERKAEAQAMMTMFLQAAPMFQAMGLPLNAKEFGDYWLRANGIDDPDRFYSAQPQAPLPGQAQQGQPGGTAGSGGNGITSPTAYSAGSPSNAASMSGEQHIARLLSQMGGANNGG